MGYFSSLYIRKVIPSISSSSPEMMTLSSLPPDDAPFPFKQDKKFFSSLYEKIKQFFVFPPPLPRAIFPPPFSRRQRMDPLILFYSFFKEEILFLGKWKKVKLSSPPFLGNLGSLLYLNGKEIAPPPLFPRERGGSFPLLRYSICSSLSFFSQGMGLLFTQFSSPSFPDGDRAELSFSPKEDE